MTYHSMMKITEFSQLSNSVCNNCENMFLSDTVCIIFNVIFKDRIEIILQWFLSVKKIH